MVRAWQWLSFWVGENRLETHWSTFLPNITQFSTLKWHGVPSELYSCHQLFMLLVTHQSSPVLEAALNASGTPSMASPRPSQTVFLRDGWAIRQKGDCKLRVDGFPHTHTHTHTHTHISQQALKGGMSFRWSNSRLGHSVELICLRMYSGKKKYVNPLEIPGFLHKLVIQFDLIFI